MTPTDQTKNKKRQRNARHHLANHRERLTCQMAESYRLKDFHTNKSSTISKRTARHPNGRDDVDTYRRCNPRVQWSSTVGPQLLHIEENTVHVETRRIIHEGLAHNSVSKEATLKEEPVTLLLRHAPLEKPLPHFAEIPYNKPKMVHLSHWKKGLF